MLTSHDVMNPFIKDVPKEWDTVPRELYERLVPRRGFYTLEEHQTLRRLLASHWLLLRNEHRFVCTRCKNVHDYFTAMCVERPFNRLTSLWGFLQEYDEASRATILSAISLGTIVPITEEDASKLKWKIALKGGRLVEWSER